jgi:hypothetical protein
MICTHLRLFFFFFFPRCLLLSRNLTMGRADVCWKYATLVMAAAFTFTATLGLTKLATSSFDQRQDQTDLHVDVIGSSLPMLHNPRHLAQQACRSVGAFEDHLGAWKRAMTRANTMPLSADNVLGKVAIRQGGGGADVRLACIIPTINADGRARKVHESWGKSCDATVYVTNKAQIEGIDKNLVLEVHPPKDDKNAWQRLRSALHHASTTPSLHDQSAFYLYAGDDSFVIVENLKAMLVEPYVQYLSDAGAPLFIGHRMVQSGVNAPFVSGTAFILNRLALDIFVAVSDNANCDPTVYSESEDILVAACFRHHNIFPLNTQDVFGEDRLHIFDAGGVAAMLRDPTIASWYPPYRRKAMPKSLDGGVSRYSFHFHGMHEGSFGEYASKLTQE